MNGKLHRLITAAPAAVALGIGAMMLAGSGTALAKINNPMLNQQFPGVSAEEGWRAG